MINQYHRIKHRSQKQDAADYSSVLKPHHRLAGFRLRRRGGALYLLNPWGQQAGKFDLDYSSPYPIWEAADLDIVYGCRFRPVGVQHG